ncbi:hypothetical protein [Listeria seeligeri]|uniref:hypothetical protein n=1 Tax=Listeria seeligeri TaxID=1640 RepID=UPI001888F6F1|nr:hypothetical protein [Listeria seeligeri]MBF2356041.1 hypothetical protein [Listeria seeligeri]
MSDYSWREEYEAVEKAKLKEERRVSEEEFKNCVQFYENLSPEEKNYYRHEIDYQSVKILGSGSLELYYPENHYKSVELGREEAKIPLQQEKISQINHHIEKEISFLEIWDGAVLYGPDMDANFMDNLDKIDYQDRVIDAAATFYTNEYSSEDDDWDEYKANTIKDMNEEVEKGENISIAHCTLPETEFAIYTTIDLENKAVVQEIVPDDAESIHLTYFQAQTEDELLAKIYRFEFEDLIAVDEEELFGELDLDAEDGFTMK